MSFFGWFWVACLYREATLGTGQFRGQERLFPAIAMMAITHAAIAAAGISLLLNTADPLPLALAVLGSHFGLYR